GRALVRGHAAVITLALAPFIAACAYDPGQQGLAPAIPGEANASSSAPAPIDPAATAETQALFRNLRALAPDAVLFGHEHDLAYGTKWRDEPGRSDVLETAGDYPSVYGWEVEGLFSNWP